MLNLLRRAKNDGVILKASGGKTKSRPFKVTADLYEPRSR